MALVFPVTFFELGKEGSPEMAFSLSEKVVMLLHMARITAVVLKNCISFCGLFLSAKELYLVLKLYTFVKRCHKAIESVILGRSAAMLHTSASDHLYPIKPFQKHFVFFLPLGHEKELRKQGLLCV